MTCSRVLGRCLMQEKNYSVFGDVVLVDSTYTTNQYNMIFVPFTGVKHHLQKCFSRGSILGK